MTCNEAARVVVIEDVIDELALGKRYSIALKAQAFPGRLEGRLRSARLPRGVLGNEDGLHSIWLSGEAFEWFLRPDEILSAEEIPENEDPLPMTAFPGRSCVRGLFPSPETRRRVLEPLGCRHGRRCRVSTISGRAER